MKNYKKNKTQSASNWPQHLFDQANRPLSDPGKIHYTHRDDVHNESAQNAFQALFTKDNNDHYATEPSRFEENFAFEHFSPAKTIDLAGTNHQLTVLNCYNETLDTKTFILGKPEGQPFAYLPGQYLSLSVVIEEKEYKRSYSLASSPTRQGCLQITVKRAANGGVVSNWLNDHLKVGDKINAKGPFGKFTCAHRSNSKILLLAAGSGIVPIMSMLRWLTDIEAKADIALLLSFTTASNIIYQDELNLLARRHRNLKLSVTLTREPMNVSGWTGMLGRIDEKMIAQQVPDVTDRDVYLCGPSLFMADCTAHLLKLNLPATQLRLEHFTVNSPQTLARTQATRRGRPSKKISRPFRIRFAKSNKTITTDGNLSLLELAEQHHIDIGHECRTGNCGECMAKCLSGTIEMTAQAEIDDFDRKKGWVYCCCAYPLSNVVLDA